MSFVCEPDYTGRTKKTPFDVHVQNVYSSYF